jgi:YVTN family beta-propeller protein
MAIQRLNYFNGQFLRENDFTVEQNYHLSMRRSHNQRSHTPGIVHGLEVVAGISQVVVKPGIAIDPDGREIVVTVDMTVPVSAAAGNAYVVIALDESKTDRAAEPDPIQFETRWTETPVASAADVVPAGAIALAQIASVAGNGAVTLNSTYRRTYSAPAVGGDLTIGRDLTVMGNLEVRGQTTQIDTEQMRGNVVLGDADTDTVTVEGRMMTGHSSGALQLGVSTVVTGNLSVQGNAVLGDADGDSVTIEGTLASGHSSGRLKVTSPLDVTEIVVSGNVDGRDVSADGTKLDTHAAAKNNPHETTAAHVDNQGGLNRLVAQINTGTGVITEPRIDTAIARESRFNTSSGHSHNGTDSRKIAPGSLQGVNASVTADALNALTGGAASDASAFHTHPFVPADGSVGMGKLDKAMRARVLSAPLLAQSLLDTERSHNIGSLDGSVVSDGTSLWTIQPFHNTLFKVDLATNAVTHAVTVTNPMALALGGGFLWVACRDSHVVHKLDPTTHAVVASITTPLGPCALAVADNFLWVANWYANSISKIDMSTNTIVNSVTVGTSPRALAVVGGFVWVANYGGISVSKVDAATLTVAATVTVGSNPTGVAATTATFLWVANSGTNSISKVDVGSNTVVGTILLSFQPIGVVVSGNSMWVAGQSQVHKFDTTNNAAVATAFVPVGVSGHPITLVGNVAWVCGGAQLSKLDANLTVSATIQPLESRGMAFDGVFMWVALYGCGRVLKMDSQTGTVVAIVPVGIRPHSVTCNATHVFVSNEGSNNVSKIDPLTATVVATIAVGAAPRGMAVNPHYNTVWVANSGGGTASVFPANAISVSTTVTLGGAPHSIASDGTSMWISNSGNNTVSRVGAWSTSNSTTNVAVGLATQAIVFDNTNVWLIGGSANTLTKIVPGNTVQTVTLPTGAIHAKMCFDGSHVLVLCANQIVYRIDIHTNAISVAVTGSTSTFGQGSGAGVLAYDGHCTWSADNGPNNVTLRARAL